MKEYIICVPYNTSRSGIETVEVTLFAKSEEQARGKAKEYVRLGGGVSQVHSTEVIRINDCE